MLRRAASGHIEATHWSKFAAASRIALAVIRGWPEAPSSPLHGGGALPVSGVACACAEAPGRCPDGAVWLPFEIEPVKILSRKFCNPPPLDDCPRASPQSNSAAAMITALVRLFANGSVRCAMSYLHCSALDILHAGRLVTVANSLTKRD